MNERNILEKYLPENTIDDIYYLIKKHKVHLTISKNRSTKLGDYRPPGIKNYHRISVNYNLNPYAFIITFLHELAHLITYEQYGNSKPPHGKEWKENYREQLMFFIKKNIFPGDLVPDLLQHLKKIKASSHADINLTRSLKRYNPYNEELLIENLTIGDIFIFKENRKFQLLEKLRKRYKAKEINSNKIYLFHALTPIKPYKSKSSL